MTAPEGEFDPERVVVRDKRRIDPVSGEVREAHIVDGSVAVDERAEEEAAGDALAADLDRVAVELTADLQRVQAEYANYRKRVDRDRALVVEMATAGLLAELLPLLDAVERARQHGDLDGAFKSVGEGIEAVATKHRLERFGEVGEPFDPAIHEALMTAEPTADSEVAVCAQVLQPGYRLASGRVLRPARVAVSEPAAAEPVVPEMPET
ncbi:MAG: nucleotide exchange factor GrpE [Frankiaceae bacterium]|nr:nucleotide exchange factor GrpE [Frankiaceae bacterium]